MATQTTGETNFDPKVAAVKDRILAHMTNDHADSLALFLNHYCKVPVSISPPSTGLKLDAIDLDHIIITHSAGRNLVKIQPPMNNFSEARSRLVAMHQECLTGLGLASFKVEAYVLPNKAWQWLVHLICAMTFITFSTYAADDFLAGSNTFPSYFWSMGGAVPAITNLAAQIKDRVLVGMLAIHLAEAAYFSQTKLRAYWIPRFSPLWWKWTGTVFLGGVAGMSRFNELVEQMKEEREKSSKH